MVEQPYSVAYSFARSFTWSFPGSRFHFDPDSSHAVFDLWFERHRAWAPGVLVALGCGAVYLILRPPLYDFDGYMYRLYAVLPNRLWNSNPHHLLWNWVQIILSRIAERIGHPTTGCLSDFWHCGKLARPYFFCTSC